MKVLASARQSSRDPARPSAPPGYAGDIGNPFGAAPLLAARARAAWLVAALFLLALMTLGAAAPVQKAKEVKIALSTRLDRTAIWVGDTFHYIVKAVHDPAIEIVIDGLKKDRMNLAPFVVLDIAVRQGPFGADKKLTEITFLLTSYETGQGELKIPTFPLYYFTRIGASRASTESAAESIAVPAGKIGLRSTLTADNLRLRDSRELWQVSRSRWMLPLALGLAGIVATAIQLARLLWHRSRHERPVKKRLNARARQRQLQDFLQQAQAIGRDTPEDQQRYYAEVSRFLRGYLSESLAIDAASLTAEEIASTLQSHGPNGLRAPVKIILERCEQVLYHPEGAHLGQGWRDEVAHELAKFAALARH